MSREPFLEKQEAMLSIHIFTVSATMVGICLTVIGIVNILSFNKRVETVTDDILAVDAILFLCACLISYLAIKTEERKRRLGLERAADTLFIAGLCIMVVVCAFIVIKW